MQKILQLDERLVWLIKDLPAELGASVTGTGITAGTAVAGDVAGDVGGGEEGWIDEGSLLKRVSQCQGDFRFLFFLSAFLLVHLSSDSPSVPGLQGDYPSVCFPTHQVLDLLRSGAR